MGGLSKRCWVSQEGSTVKLIYSPLFDCGMEDSGIVSVDRQACELTKTSNAAQNSPSKPVCKEKCKAAGRLFVLVCYFSLSTAIVSQHMVASTLAANLMVRLSEFLGLRLLCLTICHLNVPQSSVCSVFGRSKRVYQPYRWR